jgi:ribonuclease HI
MGLLEAIKTATSNGLQHVLFETDSMSLVNALNTSNTPLNEFGDLVLQCKNLLLNNSDFVVSFVRRQANKTAHSIARAALSHPSPHVFYDVPSTLYSLIMNEMQ